MTMKITREMLRACKQARKFIKMLEKKYPNIPTNSDSGLDWDTRFTLDDAITDAKKLF